MVLEEEEEEEEEDVGPKYNAVEKCTILTKERVVELKRAYQFPKGVKIRLPNSKG